MTRTFLIFVLWCIGCKISLKYKWVDVYVIVSGIVFIFCNLASGREKGSLSAYSVFNKGG